MDLNFTNFVSRVGAYSVSANAEPYAIFDVLDYSLVNVSAELLLH